MSAVVKMPSFSLDPMSKAWDESLVFQFPRSTTSKINDTFAAQSPKDHLITNTCQRRFAVYSMAIPDAFNSNTRSKAAR